MAWASLMAFASALFGYTVRTDDSDVYVIKWPAGSIVMRNMVSATVTPDGLTLRSSVGVAIDTWNAQIGTVQIVNQSSSATTYSSGNGINEMIISDTIDGQAFSQGTLAVTSWYSSGNTAREADIVFNGTANWSSYRGNVRPGSQDIQRVAAHELGHVLGLDHPDEAGQSVVAVMNSHVSNIDTLQPDDIAGGRLLYGAPGVVPGNDNFSAATTVVLASGSVQLMGSNIGASRELGEPNHAAVVKGHSVWWKWTPSTSGPATLDTLGSNFDTVLAVYTGSQVSVLTAVASNDDTETVSQNPTPQRKRTSTVNFAVKAGTTYYIAVDGWLSSQTGSDGSTGSITLTVSFETTAAPAFISQPANKNVQAGQTAQFIAAASGAPEPAYRWQRMTVGGTWADLVEGGGYTGTQTSTLTVNTTLSMDGQQFRNTAFNSAGSATSNAALLRVTAAPTPPGSTPPSGSRLVNISSRGFCGTNDRVMIGGFVVSGNGAKRVLVRAVGPTLTAQGIGQAEVLLDPVIEVHKGAPVIASNDNLADNANAAEIKSTAAQIGAFTLLASDTTSSALLLTLDPGVYSFVASGKNGASGIVLLEVYDADMTPNDARFFNIASRAYSTTGNGVTIGGFVVSGTQPKQVLLRAVGPTLTTQGINQADVLVDPVIELRQAGNTTPIATNDNWIDVANSSAVTTTGARIGATPFAASDTRSSALLITLNPGVYSFVASGKSGTSGIVLVEVYDAD